MPIIAPIMKVQSCCNLNAVVVVRGKDMGEAKRIALEIAQEKQLLYINGYVNVSNWFSMILLGY